MFIDNLKQRAIFERQVFRYATPGTDNRAMTTPASATTSDRFDQLALPPSCLSNLEQLGYTRMTPIQAAALPRALAPGMTSCCKPPPFWKRISRKSWTLTPAPTT